MGGFVGARAAAPGPVCGRAKGICGKWSANRRRSMIWILMAFAGVALMAVGRWIGRERNGNERLSSIFPAHFWRRLG